MGLSENIRRALPRGVRSSNEKLLPVLGFIAHNSRGEHAPSVKVAEGEELGSNLLRVSPA